MPFGGSLLATLARHPRQAGQIRPGRQRTLGFVLFRRSDADSRTTVADDSPTVTDDAPVASAPKGRPTPTRKQAEQARKEALKKPVSSKTDKRAERERVRDQRAKQRSAMMAGDERALPARDQGPVRGFVRDFIDSRRTVAEFFVPIAVVVLLLGLTRNLQVQMFVTLIWFVSLVVVIGDMAFLLWRMNRALKAKFPDKSQRRGVNFYAVMRSLQIRKLRVPPPKFKAGGKPVVPKVKKPSKSA